MKKISVVVPVYNASRYLERCIESVLSQTYQNIELLLIDNGSTDNSLDICKKYEQDDSRVRVLIEDKKGPSCARNKGIKEMSGDYLVFVDSDDYLEKEVYSILVSLMELHNSQMVVCSWLKYNESSNIQNKEDIGVAGEITIDATRVKEVIAAEDIKYGGGFPWNRMINWEYVRNKRGNLLLFDEELVVYEDKLWVMKLLNCLERVTISDFCGYHYIIRDGSLSHSLPSTSKCVNCVDAWSKIVNECQGIMNDDIKFHYYDALLRMIFFMYKNKDLNIAFGYWKKYRDIISRKMLLRNKKNIIKLIVLGIRYFFYRGEK